MSAQKDEVQPHVEFFQDAIQDPVKSREAGRPIFKDMDMVRIRIPGDKGTVLVAPAHMQAARVGSAVQGYHWISYVDRFPEHWKLYQAGQSQASAAGTPLKEAPFMTEAQRANMRAVNVFTIEQLAALEGAGLASAGMGARQLKNQAVEYLERADAGAATSRLAAENEQLRNDMAAMKAQIAALTGAAPAPVPAAAPETAPTAPVEGVTVIPNPSDPKQPLGALSDPSAVPLAAPTEGVGTVEDDVVIGGPFNGMDREALREYIKDNTGEYPLGFTKTPKLLESAAEIAASIQAQAGGHA